MNLGRPSGRRPPWRGPGLPGHAAGSGDRVLAHGTTRAPSGSSPGRAAAHRAGARGPRAAATGLNPTEVARHLAITTHTARDHIRPSGRSSPAHRHGAVLERAPRPGSARPVDHRAPNWECGDAERVLTDATGGGPGGAVDVRDRGQCRAQRARPAAAVATPARSPAGSTPSASFTFDPGGTSLSMRSRVSSSRATSPAPSRPRAGPSCEARRWRR